MFTEAFGLMLETPDDAQIENINFTNLKIYYLAPSIFSLIRMILFITYIRFESPSYYIQ